MTGGTSFPEGCLLLLLYMYITSRPDKAASETQWLQLEQEVKLLEPLLWPAHHPTPEPLFLLLGTKGALIHFGNEFSH